MDTAISSLPSEWWASQVRDLLIEQGIPARIDYRGPRAWQVLIEEGDAAAAAYVMADLGYLTCTVGAGGV